MNGLQSLEKQDFVYAIHGFYRIMMSPWLKIGISSYIPYHLRDLRCLCNNKIMYTLRRLSYCAFDKCYTWKTLIMAMCALAPYAYANNIIHTKMHVSGYYNGSWLRFYVNIFSNFGISLVVKRRFHCVLFIIVINSTRNCALYCEI